jgi:steroid 5-alpha reductase family enzyme
VIGSPWVAFAIAAGGISLVMAALWLVQVRTGDASHVDVAWAYGIGAAGVFFAAVADGGAAHRALLGALAAAWSARLGTYILVNRVLGKEEDGRYRALREKWGAQVNRRFFVFFQAQAFFVIVFSVPLLLTAYDPSGSLGALTSTAVMNPLFVSTARCALCPL